MQQVSDVTHTHTHEHVHRYSISSQWLWMSIIRIHKDSQPYSTCSIVQVTHGPPYLLGNIYYTRQQAVLNSNERKFNISHWSTHNHGAVSVASWCVLLFLFRISSNSATHCRTRGSVKRPVARYMQQALALGNEHSPGLELVAVLVCTCTSHACIYAPTHSPTHKHERMNGQTHTRMRTHTHTQYSTHT